MPAAILLLAAATLVLLASRIVPSMFATGLAALLLVGALVAGIWLLRSRDETFEGARDWMGIA